MGNIETRESRAAREAEEAAAREARRLRYEEKMGVAPVLRNTEKPVEKVLCNTEEVKLRNNEQQGEQNELCNKRDAAWWREYRKRPRVCPHCGKELTKVGGGG